MSNDTKSSQDKWTVRFSVPSDPGFGIYETTVDGFESVPKMGTSVNLTIEDKGARIEFAVIGCKFGIRDNFAEVELRPWDQSARSN